MAKSKTVGAKRGRKPAPKVQVGPVSVTLIDLLKTPFYAGAADMAKMIKSMDAKIEKFNGFRPYYERRFHSSNSRSLLGIKNQAQDIVAVCEQLLNTQALANKLAKMPTSKKKAPKRASKPAVQTVETAEAVAAE